MYRAPVREVRFVLEELLGAGSLAASAELADYSDELARSVLEEAARFAEGVLEPLNRPGDLHGARWTPDGVVTAPGFRDAYRQFAAAGWTALGADPKFGGQPAPRALVSAAGEFWGSACLAFKLGPMLTHGAVHALELCGSATQKDRYLPRMISGEWTGTMVLTEPQAGSDLGLVRTRAVPDGDRYRLFGQKIFITWGDHDLTPNTLHMVLARIEGAPAGVRGISLFVVPKVLVNPDGSLGARNDVRCLSVEHKLGIHASPTCVLAFGEKQGALADLVGEPGRGLEYMFIMMNSARLSVGSEGYAVGERALQRATEWARTRLQGKALSGAGPVPIIHHPDVKRMLLTTKSQTGAAQYVRDVRITTIYEGTTGIQGNDLIGRKLGRDRGAAIGELIAAMERELRSRESGDPAVLGVREAALGAVAALKSATQALLRTLASRPEVGLAVSVPYLKLCGYVIGGWLLAKSAAIAAAKVDGPESAFYAAKIRTAAFYAAQVLPTAAALARVVEGGGASVAETDAALI